MGKRFAIVIGVAAAGVMALGAQPAAAVVKYDTELTISVDRGRLYGGYVRSDRDGFPGFDSANAVKKCEQGRRVALFKRRPGPDRKLGTARSVVEGDDAEGKWGVLIPHHVHHVHGRRYAKVRPEKHDRFVCHADRSEIIGGGAEVYG
jgi:hypothetical protein